MVAGATSVRVAIIGGGFAGLSAAAELEKNGIDYILFEASSRLGGRVFPVKDNHGGTLQLGAEFINGEDNEIHRIAKRFGLLSHKADDDGYFYSKISFGLVGENISSEDLEVWKSFIRPLEKIFEREALAFPEISVAESFQRKYVEFLKNHQKKRKVFDILATLYRNYYETEWSSPVEELALANFQEWDDKTNDSASWYLKGKGFAVILRELKKNISIENVRLNSYVSNLDWSKDNITVTLKDGETELFDYAIVTVPLGFLKRHIKFFTPTLPKEKRAIIGRLGFGNLVKIFLEYDDPWWGPNIDTLMAVKEEVYEQESDESKLMKSMQLFQVCSNRHNTLLLWIAGEGSILAGKLSKEELASVVTRHLQAQFNNNKIPDPKDVFTYNWSVDPLFNGAYSYVTPESYVNTIDSFRDMAKPILKEGRPLICFAGEHTHQTMYQTTIGAYESGLREAQRLIDYLLEPKN